MSGWKYVQGRGVCVGEWASEVEWAVCARVCVSVCACVCVCARTLVCLCVCVCVCVAEGDE